LTPDSANPIKRDCQIPRGKALFFPLINVECSNMEEPPFFGETAESQARMAQYFADHMTNLFCEINGIFLSNLEAYRVQNQQICFSPPASWIQSDAGGVGTSSGDGYFIFLAPLPTGEHTLRFGGTIHLTWPQDFMDLHEEINMAYHITVKDAPP